MDGGSYLLLFQGIQAANAAAQQTALSNQLGQDQLAWAKQQYAQDKATNQPIIDTLINGMNQTNAFGKQQQQFYTDTYQPIERQFAQTAQNWASPERQEQQAAQAGADVAQQYKSAQDAAAQNLKDFGVNVSSPRYASLSLLTKLGQAGATAGVENQARTNTQLQGLQLQQQAIANGQADAGIANQSYNTGTNQGNSAVQNTLATTQSGAQTMGTAPQYYGQGNQAINTWGGIANNNYSNYMQGYQADRQNTTAQGWMNLAGSIAGAAGGAASAYMMRPKAAVGGMIHAEEGGAVPVDASPSRGTQTDDVPAMLNDGEFVIPKEAVSWFGEKAFHDMIIKAQKQRAETQAQSGAVPEMAPPPRQQQSAAALPVG